jgi:hypothetical protein
MHQVFPHVSFWVIGGQGVLVATSTPQVITAEGVARIRESARKFATPSSNADRILSTLMGSRLLAPEDVSRMLEERPFPVNTDANRYLEYATPRYNLSPEPHYAQNLRVLGAWAQFPPIPCESPLLRDLELDVSRLVPIEQKKAHFGLP